MAPAEKPHRPRLLVYDVGFGPRPSWYLPKLCASYQVQVLWTASGDAGRDEARAAAFATWCGHRKLAGRATARAELLALARSWLPAGITTFGELGVSDVHEVAGMLGLPANKAESLPALRNKYEQRRMLQAAGVPVPRFARVRDTAQLIAALESVGRPAVLKPVAGAGSMATFAVDDRTDPGSLWAAAQAAIASDPRAEQPADFVLEEFLVGRRAHADERYGIQVSVESLVQDGEIRHLAVSDKLALAEPFREVCDILPSSLPIELTSSFCSVAAEAITALGIANSAVHTELMLTAQGPRVIEVNSRVGGGVTELMHHSHGYDMVAAMAAIATGELLPPLGPPRKYAAFLTPQAPSEPARLVAVPSEATLAGLPGVVGATVNYRVGDIPNSADGTRGGTLARMFAVADEPGSLLDLSDLMATGGHFSYDTGGALLG